MAGKYSSPVHGSQDTFTESETAGAPLAAPEAYLALVLECERPASGSSRHCLRGIDEITIGRGDDRAAVRDGPRLRLTVPSGWMSATHARIVRRDGTFHIEDLGSRNGTRVNGRPTVHLALADGDVVEAGHTLFIFRDALHAPRGTPLDLDTRDGVFPARGLETLLPALAAEFDALARIAESAVPVLLRGETGTGKEVVARAIHALSKRPGSLVPVNCGALPQTLVEGQLFGHVRGAFSGAVRDEAGFVRAAHGGTLFLDEIADLPPASQAALLRVLQEGEVVPLGTTRAVPVDVRVVAATHQPIEQLVSKGAFRADLLARLDGFTFALPPLRARREDIGLLVASVLAAAAPGSHARAPGTNAAPFAVDVGRALLGYAWPMNIRELHHALARAVALAAGGPIELQHLPPAVASALAGGASEAPREHESDPDARLRGQIEGLLATHDGNVAEVARALGKARMQVHRWMRRLAIDPKRYRR